MPSVEEPLIPEAWLGVLQSLVQGGFPEACIAGGAMRDLMNGKPVKDVDIFVKSKRLDILGFETPIYDTAGTTDLLRKALGAEIKDATGNSEDDYPWDGGFLLDVFDYSRDDVLYQIVVTSADCDDDLFLSRVLDDFDVAFCQMGCRLMRGGALAINLREAALKDWEENTLTVLQVPSVTARDRTERHINRMLQKYPDFKPVWPT